MFTKRILILEDDLEAVSLILKSLKNLEDQMLDKNIDFAVTVLSEYNQVEEYINKTKTNFDVIFLDRDCKAGGSFHILDFEKFKNSKIISISSIPEWNEEAKKRGVKIAIRKDYNNLWEFAQALIEEVKKTLK